LIFNHLKTDDIKKIIDIQLKLTRETLEKQDKELVISDEVIDYIIKEGYSREYGARHISRCVRKHILEKVAHLSLEKEWDYARQVSCSMDKEVDDVVVHLEPVGIETLEDDKFIEGVNVE
jgi:ATP-dependent Clp protease ATP-binding subunit ClpC